MGILTNDEIENLKLIHEGFEKENLQPCSYDLRLGSEYIDSSGKKKKLGVKKIGSDKLSLLIGPYESCMVTTHEKVKLPNNVIAHFDLKAQQTFKGLIFQRGLMVEPGYKGILMGLLLNLTNDEIELELGEALFNIEFLNINNDVVPKPKRKETINSFEDLFHRAPATSGLAILYKEFKQTYGEKIGRFLPVASIYAAILFLIITIGYPFALNWISFSRDDIKQEIVEVANAEIARIKAATSSTLPNNDNVLSDSLNAKIDSLKAELEKLSNKYEAVLKQPNPRQNKSKGVTGEKDK